MRIGAKKKPFYRVVVVDERAKRTGAYVELLGTYNPLTEPKDIQLKKDRIEYWIKQGAQPSTGYLRIIGKAPQRPPRKPKKEKKTEVPAAGPEPVEKTSKEEAHVKETAVEETAKSEPENQTSETPASAEQTEKETQSSEKTEVVDDSAVQAESTEPETSESVQNKNERPA